MGMRFAERLEAGQFALALEITPPQRHLPKVLLRRARLLGDSPQAINVVQREGRQPSLDASLALRSEGLEPAWHLVCRGRRRDEIEADLLRAREAGVGLILCILGDHPAGENTGVSVREVIAMAREAVPGATIGATLNQYGADRERSLRNLLGKLRAGASYVQLQPVFELAAAEWFAEAIDRELPQVKVVAMVMPLLSIEAAERIEERLGIRLPSALREVLATGSEDAAWEAFEATLRELVASPWIDGAAIMTFEPDAAPDAGKRILSVLRRCGALD